jgi:hypothetical protein
MNPTMRRLAPFVVAALVVIVGVVVIFGGRGSGTPGASASASASASPSASGSPSQSPSAEPSASASASASAPASASASPPSTVVPTASAPPSPSPSAVACAVKPQTGLLSSDRVVSVEVSTSATMDFVTFVFDTGSPSPAGPPRGDLSVARPPFTFASSGLPIDLQGQHALQVRFSQMSLSNDAGEPTFTGDPNVQVDFPALRQAIMYDESEGIAAWYIGYDGTGCVNLVKDGLDIVVTIAHS